MDENKNTNVASVASDSRANEVDKPTDPENEMSEMRQSSPYARKKKPKRALVTTGVVILILVIAGIGMFVWHESPSFCSTVCHTPMSNYVEDFYNSDDDSLMAVAHAHLADGAALNCLSCHVPTLSEQISEGITWISGSYSFNSVTGQLRSRSDELACEQFCLRSGCHDGIDTADDLTAVTADLEVNPHDWSQHGYIACGNCHKSHISSVFYCTQCHLDATFSSVPDGWTVYMDGRQYVMHNGHPEEIAES